MTTRKTTYVNSPIHLTESQLRKLKLNEPCIVRIDPSKKANHHLLLTQTQVNQLNNAKSAGTSKDLKISKTQLEKNGGFIITIPTLLAGIGAAASMAGAAGGIAKAVNDKKHNDQMESEAKRHNKKVENLLLANTNTGKGAYLPRKTAKGVFLPRRN